jgi:hypothetical protein
MKSEPARFLFFIEENIWSEYVVEKNKVRWFLTLWVLVIFHAVKIFTKSMEAARERDKKRDEIILRGYSFSIIPHKVVNDPNLSKARICSFATFFVFVNSNMLSKWLHKPSK